MPQQDQRAAELDHGEEVGCVAFPSRGEAAEVLQPGEQPFNLPAAQITAQWSAVLSPFSFSPIGRDHFDAMVAKPFIERIAVVGLVSDQSLRQGGNMSLCECVFDQG
jgi:hypothetical protein